MKPTQTKLYGSYTSIQHGKRGLVVTLPSHFVNLNNIKAGTAINAYLVEGDSSYLLLKPEKKR